MCSQLERNSLISSALRGTIIETVKIFHTSSFEMGVHFRDIGLSLGGNLASVDYIRGGYVLQLFQAGQTRLITFFVSFLMRSYIHSKKRKQQKLLYAQSGT